MCSISQYDSNADITILYNLFLYKSSIARILYSVQHTTRTLAHMIITYILVTLSHSILNRFYSKSVISCCFFHMRNIVSPIFVNFTKTFTGFPIYIGEKNSLSLFIPEILYHR